MDLRVFFLFFSLFLSSPTPSPGTYALSLFYSCICYIFLLIFFPPYFLRCSSPVGNTMTNPRRMHSPDQSERSLQHDSTLVVNEQVSLTLGSDSLVIVGKYFHQPGFGRGNPC